MEGAGSWVMGASAPANALTALWRRQWPHSHPFAEDLKFTEVSHWVRFHTLPASKRYPDSPQEHSEVSRRHQTLLTDLASTATTAGTATPGAEPLHNLLLITCGDSGSATPVRPQTPVAQIPADWHWMSMDNDRAPIGLPTPGQDEQDPSKAADITGEEERWWRHLYATTTTAGAPQVSELLRLVADGHAWGVLIIPPDLRWLYHPYDGGADVVTATTAERDALSARHRSWLPTPPDSL